MTNLNDKINKYIRAIITVTLYFIWPTITSNLLNILKVDKNPYGNFVCYLILLVIIVSMYFKDIKSSMEKISLKKNIYLFLILTVVQISTNLLSVTIIGVNNHSSYGGLLPSYLDKWPVLMGFCIAVYYPIVESLVFNKTLKDIINSKWAFIICSSLFFWLVNLVAFDFKSISIIATLSCFTTSIVINYFYYKEDNISSIIIVKMIYNLVFLLLP